MTESQSTISLEILQARLDARARELQAAGVTIHALKLEQMARDRQICELKARLFELEIASIDAQVDNLPATLGSGEPLMKRTEVQLARHIEELALQEQLVAAAEQERAAHLEYIQHLKTELAESHRERTE